jgi:hypothetical protein
MVRFPLLHLGPSFLRRYGSQNHVVYERLALQLLVHDGTDLLEGERTCGIKIDWRKSPVQRR